MNQQRMIFLHLQKTAGTAFQRQVLVRSLSPRHVYAYLSPWRTWRDLHAPALRDVRCVTGHLYYGLHYALPGTWTYITILRNPLERALSYYDWILQKRPARQHRYHTLAKQRAVGDFFSLPYLDNGMTRRLAGYHTRCFRRCTRRHLEQAVKHLEEHFSLIGLQEELGLTSRLFSAWAGLEEFFPCDHRVRHRANPTYVSNLDPDSYSRLEACHAYDLELYEYGKALFRKQLEIHNLSIHSRSTVTSATTSLASI